MVGNAFICNSPCLQSRHRKPASISTPQPAQQRGNTNSFSNCKNSLLSLLPTNANSLRSSIFHHTLRPLTTHHTDTAGRVSSVSSHKTETEFYKSPLSCSRSFNREYRRRVRSLATAVCSAAFVPTSSTFSLARVTAVYSRFRCSMI